MTEIAKIENRTPITPMDLLQKATESGADLDKLEKLMDLQERWEKNEARKAYISAMMKFKESPPVIKKDSHVFYKTDKGTTEYDHASHNQVSTIVGEALSSCGIMHSWKSEQLDNGQIRVTCTLTHIDGHSESNSLQSSADQTGGKNNIQAIISTTTYLQRHTLLAVAGLGTTEKDTDGVGPVEYITEEQMEELFSLNEKRGNTPEQFCDYLEINSLSELPASRYHEIKQSVAAKGVK